ncbi:MAG: hypothetical protein V4459_09495 [Pseudomonadota bacterium]
MQTGSTGGGVRCVKFVDYALVGGQITGVYWYGEGTLNQYVYRHLGNVYVGKDPATGASTIVSLAADIYGNGENATFSATDLTLHPIDGIKLIQEESDWPEQWILEPSGVADYISTLGPVARCGKFFRKFTVEGGRGVRCSILPHPKNQYPDRVWYSDSDRGLNRQLGIVIGVQPGAVDATAVDLCATARCPGPQTEAVKLKAIYRCGQPARIWVTGSRSERWTGPEWQCPPHTRIPLAKGG